MKKLNVDRITRFGELPLYHSKEWEDLKLDEDAIAEYRKYMGGL